MSIQANRMEIGRVVLDFIPDNQMRHSFMDNYYMFSPSQFISPFLKTGFHFKQQNLFYTYQKSSMSHPLGVRFREKSRPASHFECRVSKVYRDRNETVILIERYPFRPIYIKAKYHSLSDQRPKQSARPRDWTF